MKTLILVVTVWMVFPFTGRSQQKTDSLEIYQIQTDDGNEYVGNLVEETETHYTIHTENLGLLQIKKTTVKKMIKVTSSQIHQGHVWTDNPQSARYFWAPNGYGLKKGEGYYQNIWVLFNQVSYGFTDHFSLGAGLMPLFLFASDVNPVWIQPKFSFPVVKDKFNLGAGTIFFHAIGEDGSGGGLLFLTATAGSTDQNISLGMAYAYTLDDMSSVPLWNLSLMNRLNQKTYLISENYLAIHNGEVGGFLSLGLRKMVKRVGLDFGLFVPFAPDMEQTIALPWLGISVPFGK